MAKASGSGGEQPSMGQAATKRGCSGTSGGILRMLCLRPTWSLRRQLLTSFGLTNVLAIVAVMLIATLTTKRSGENVKEEARQSLTVQVTSNLGASTRYTAETLTKKLFDNLGGAAAILEEGTRDRIVGYPEEFEDDSFVPFVDSISNTNRYPLSSPPLPLDWNLKSNINQQNAAFHLGEGRLSWYGSYSDVTTANAIYFQQGQCDPSVSDKKASTYFQGCSNSSNDVLTGGTVLPTPTNKGIYEKASDLSVLLKSLFESHEEVKTIGVYFANSGAGSHVSFPGALLNETLTYTSIGCGWMSQPNPLLRSKTIGTPEEIGRCQQPSATVSGRRYNVLERGWCRDQALHPGETQITGPYLDATSEHLWLLTIGRSVYDRVKKSFIGCTLLDVSISRIEAILDAVEIGETSEIALVRWDDGTVVASPKWETDTAQDTLKIADLDLGIDDEAFEKIREAVDYSKPWTPEDVQQTYTTTIFQHKGRLAATYPVPIPVEYDETYQPKYLVILSIQEAEIYQSVDKMDSAIDDDSDDIIKRTLMIGFCGMVLVLLIIIMVSLFLTKPLEWMADVADQIVANAGNKNLDEGIQFDQKKVFYPCTPTTEVTYLVSEFFRMIHGLGGTGAAKVASAHVIHDILNIVPWDQNVFGGIYGPKKRMHSSLASADTYDGLSPISPVELALSPITRLRYSIERFCASVVEKGEKSNVLLPQKSGSTDSLDASARETGIASETKGENAEKRNKGTHVRTATNVNDGTIPAEKLPIHDNSRCNGIFKSPLFWWITILIITPLLLTMVAICTIVSLDITDSLPTWLEDVEAASVALERYAITTAATARAHFGKQVIAEPVRDIHLVTRTAAWLLFGALERSNTFTALDEATEECKTAAIGRICPFYSDKSRSFCDCNWNDVYGRPCSFLLGDTRARQKMFYAGQSHDADNFTGNRTQISFVPGSVNDDDYSPDTTAWWHNIMDLPGELKGENASGYETTYDRVRVLSALGVSVFPVFNHARSPGSENYFGIYVGLETDGMMLGYVGCDYSYAEYSNFQSTNDNGAASIRKGTLCPLGKYGYDCRCRDWYDTGKRKGISTSNLVHVTPPYIFTGGEIVASSMTASLIDPRDSTHVGQVLIDFSPGAIIDALDRTNVGQTENGFSILVTPESDALGGDTVVGPGYSLSDGTSPSISDLVLPDDELDSENRIAFKKDVLDKMKAGGTSATTFTRKGKDKNKEHVYMAWAPVNVTTLRPQDSSNFTHGVDAFETVVYSLGIAIPESDLVVPFVAIEDDINGEIDRSTAILIALIVVAAVIAALIASSVALSVTGTVQILLAIVNKINQGLFIEDLPKFSGGSLETYKVYGAFERMFKVVRFSNHAFFSGDLHKAYSILADTFELFCSLDNKKAIGIASNNLGNVLLQIGREYLNDETRLLDDEKVPFEALTYLGFSIRERARQHFDEAIQIGEKEYQAAIGDKKGDFAQQQANRHFNRALFLLETRTKRSAEEERLELEVGLKDLLTAKQYDDEVCDMKGGNALDGKWASIHFETLLRRVQGLSCMLQVKGVEDVWGADEILAEAESVLRAESENDTSPLFHDISMIGRLQQLECQQINVMVARGEKDKALEVASRMIVEDEYILSSVFPIVSEQLFDHLKSVECQASTSSLVLNSLLNMGGDEKMMNSEIRSIGKNIFFCLDYSGSMGTQFKSKKTGRATTRILSANENLLKIFDDHIGNHDNVGFLRFNSFPDNQLFFTLTQKGGNTKELRGILSRATDTRGGTRMYMAIMEAVERIVQSDCCFYETWIIALTDGISMDSHHEVQRKIVSLNKERRFKIHIIVVGVEVPEYYVVTCKEFCRITKKSAYIDARGGLDAMNKAFEQVAQMISRSGATMETF